MENENPNVRLLLKCELRARRLQVIRHIPGKKRLARAKCYGNTQVMSTEEGRAFLIQAIQAGKPFMAARFGTSEGTQAYQYCKRLLSLPSIHAKRYRQTMCVNAGFFPNDPQLLDKWSAMELESAGYLDLLGSMNFVGEEYIYRTYCNNAKLMPAAGLSSAANGWTWCLEGKKVLVIHPFTDTIRSQYSNHREEIFPGSNTLPLFDLKCVKAVQTIADAEDKRFADWFEALDYMTEEAAKQDFDVALIGCGAYGFQLASRIKQMGKIAVHMGGCLQTLFGIKGGRWDQQYGDMYTDAWVYPSKEETPAGAEKVESGCYWKT